MKQYDVPVDSRIVGICIYCGGIAKTRDHVPSKAFLDKPYPENIPVALNVITNSLKMRNMLFVQLSV